MKKKNVYLAIIIFLIILFLYINSQCNNFNLLSSFISYPIDNKEYKVLNNINYLEAAKLLNKVDNNLIYLINYINNKYKNIDTFLYIPEYKKNEIKNIIKKINSRYKSESLNENFPTKKGKNVSYNINKGEEISLCLRDYNNTSQFHKFNDIMFVAIHELAHSCTVSYGHDNEFWNNFKFLLYNAIESGIYINYNYKKNPVEYCSMQITYNPIFDDSLDTFV